MSKEERVKRYAELRGRMGRSKIAVTAPEGIHPFWASKDNEYEMARLDWLGFKIVREDMTGSKPKRFDAAGLRSDGTYVLGDVILMEIDSETYALQKEIELDQFQEMQDGIPREFASKASEAKAPVFEVNDKGERVPVSPA
jgi:hypothetical protein